ncbi:hypothetical protein NL676_031461 [Syzygium grande]|nr:hypothetical protein NL676_031461 [Syzygium grande]
MSSPKPTTSAAFRPNQQPLVVTIARRAFRQSPDPGPAVIGLPNTAQAFGTQAPPARVTRLGDFSLLL